jgi:ribosome maturation factor RimP
VSSTPRQSRPSGGKRPPSSSRPPRGAQGSAVHDAVVALLEPAVAASGLDLEDVELRHVGRRLVVRVLVDSDAGVTLDEVAAASQTVSDALDGSDVLGDEPYTLEVSSPGVDRPLTLPRHWRRSTGRLVEATLRSGEKVVGRVVEPDDGSVRLEITAKGRSSTRTIALADVVRAVVQVEFNRKEAEPLDGGADADAAADAADEADEADEADDDVDDEDEEV